MNQEPARARFLRLLPVVGPLLFFAVATVEGALRVGYDPIAHPISALALGPRGCVQQVNFALLAASLLSFAIVLRKKLSPGLSSFAVPGILLLMTIGVTAAGIFPMDALGAPPTLVGRLHVVAGFLVFPWMPVLMLVAARRFRQDPVFRAYFGYTLATALLSLATIVFFLVLVGPPGSPPRPFSAFAGLVQRVQLLPFFTWIAVIAGRALRGTNAGYVVTTERRDHLSPAAGRG